eukprot:CAMPEP_0183473914 /NCGR_PEP_ID=MMETSP0370-20130417/162186_1 /TAXON_ID=268820 /ORGANISM="Peridinium aciculiferum, Strain PAER-2" /LENGTH=39 /DNA_ID= /DNA_START= /DNA_END= /DNA_ORIENTATION=
MPTAPGRTQDFDQLGLWFVMGLALGWAWTWAGLGLGWTV